MLPGHPLAERPSARFSSCAEYELVLPAKPLALCQQVDALRATSGVETMEAAASDDIQMIKSLVLEGRGVGILTSLDVASEVRSGQLAFTPIMDPIAKPLALYSVSSRQLSTAANLVLGRIAAPFPELT